MRTSCRLLAALACWVGLAAHARADILISPPIFHAEQTIAVCQLFNGGAPTLNLTLFRMMRSDTGAALPAVNNTCGATLAPNKGCYIAAPVTAVFNINGTTSPVCKVATPQKATNLRAILTLYNNVFQALRSSELR